MILVEPKKKSLGDVYDRSNNLFDLLRTLFALMVVYYHSLVLFYGVKHPPDPIATLTQSKDSFGSLAVGGFFAISGFLITQSWVSGPKFIKYMSNRMLRIMPALIASSLFAAFVIGPLLSNMPLSKYLFLESGATPVKYVLNSLAFGTLSFGSRIRDIFLNNPYPIAVNGSIWTLKYEFLWYLLIPLVLLIVKKKKSVLLIPLLFFIVSIVVLREFNIQIISKSFWFFGKEYSHFIRVSSQFLIGSLIYLFRDRIRAGKEELLIYFSLLIMLMITGFSYYAFVIILPLFVITFGVNFSFSRFGSFGDPSYGIYIYSFPIQQAIISALPSIQFFYYVNLVFFITITLAYISWHAIEKPALKLKSLELSNLSKYFFLRRNMLNQQRTKVN